MVFSSLAFIFVFMPVVLAAYFIVPGRGAKNTWLLLASLVFYAWGEPVYILLMMASILVNWAFGIALGPKSSKAAKRRGLLIAAVIFNLAIIGFFKYEGFVAQNVNALIGRPAIPDLELPLPIGISTLWGLAAQEYWPVLAACADGAVL